MGMYGLVLGTLVVWRITHLLNAEDGPFDLCVRLRRGVGAGFWGGLMDCFYCLSLWVAAPVAFLMGVTWRECLLLWPALSGAAILLQRASERNRPRETAMYWEDPEPQHGMLREETKRSEHASELSRPASAPE